MRLSAIYARVGNIKRAAELFGTPKDIDVHQQMTDVFRARDDEARAETKARGFEKRAYATSDINTPRLQNFAVDYEDGTSFIADAVAPIVPTNGNPARKYTVFPRRNIMRIIDDRVAPKGQPKEMSLDMSSATYVETDRAEMAKIANKDLHDAADIPELLDAHNRALKGDLKRARELRVATIVMDSTKYASGCTTPLSSTARWDVGAATSTADPLTDILITAKSTASVGAKLNAAACSEPVANYLRKHPSVTAKAGTTAGSRVLTYDELRQLFELDYFFVGDLRYDSTGSKSTATPLYAWGKGFALMHVKPGASMHDSSFMKSFFHEDLSFIEETDNIPGVKGLTILKGSYSVAEVVTASDNAFLLDTVIS